ncbi:MAG: DUF5011 domain-containing protein [Candidatus Pacebacteria bacterium]|jgi:hypothetical protein|nr:DUF5011 domain-containing protein [Candidatus Paceibacterota bacterium]
MKKVTTKIVIFVGAILLPLSSFAQLSEENCSSKGYTIGVINGIKSTTVDVDNYITEINRHLPDKYNREVLSVKKLYNPTHGFTADFNDAIKQKLLEASGNVQDADFVTIFNTAKNSVKTQKLLLLAHSQGNFYANTFYDAVVGRDGGLPFQSVGMYSIATPANRVSGGGEYLTSSNDDVIAGIVAKTSTGYTLPANDTLEATPADNMGHGLLEVYLKQRSGKIMGGIGNALGRLIADQTRDENISCIAVELPQTTTVVIGQVIAGGLVVGANQTIDNVVFATNVAVEKVTPVVAAISNAITQGVSTVASVSRLLLNFVNNPISIAPSLVLKYAPPVILGVANDFSNNNSASVILATTPANQQVDTTTEAPLPAEYTSKDTAVAILDSQNDTPLNSVVSQREVNTPPSSEPAKDSAPVISPESFAFSFANSGGGGGAYATPTTQGVATPPLSAASSRDVIPPVVTILGQNPATSTVGIEYRNEGATALDDIDGTISVIASSTVDVTTPGIYEILYTATDKAGNIATSTRAVHILVDTTAPIITILGESVESIEEGEGFVDKGATASDDTEGTVVVSATSTVDTLRAGEYAVVYTAMDRFGNRATSTRMVSVVLKPGKQINFFENNKILYGGPFVLCNITTRTVVAAGATLPMQSFVSTEILKQSASLGSKYRVIFGKNIETSKECNSGIYTSNVSNIFYFNDTSPGVIAYDPRSASFITSIDFEEIESGVKTIIDASTHLITVVVPRGTDISSLTPRFGVSLGATISPAGGGLQDFSSPVSYIVKALDKSSHSYTVKVVTQGEELKFDNNNFINRGGYLNLCDIKEKRIYSSGRIYGGRISSTSWSTISQVVPNSGMVINKNYRFIFTSYSDAAFDCANDVTIADSSELFYYATPIGTSVVYGLYVSPPPSSEKSITTFDFIIASSTVSGLIDEAAKTVTLTVPYGTNVTSLVSNIVVSAKATSSPATGVAQDFTNPVAYVVTAEDDTTQSYTVSVVVESPPVPPLSSEKLITSFEVVVASTTFSGVVDNVVKTISITVPHGTNITSLTPMIAASLGATSSPATGVAQDFTNPITYVVTAEDGTTESYIVTVTASPDTTSPTILSYAFNGNSESLLVSSTTTPVTLSFTASEAVNWMSLKLEHQDDVTKYKMFQSDSSACVDGMTTCTKVWNVDLSPSGTPIVDGVYRVKAHVKDAAGNEFSDYLSPFIITVAQKP